MLAKRFVNRMMADVMTSKTESLGWGPKRNIKKFKDFNEIDDMLKYYKAILTISEFLIKQYFTNTLTLGNKE